MEPNKTISYIKGLLLSLVILLIGADYNFNYFFIKFPEELNESLNGYKILLIGDNDHNISSDAGCICYSSYVESIEYNRCNVNYCIYLNDRLNYDLKYIFNQNGYEVIEATDNIKDDKILYLNRSEDTTKKS